MILPVKEVKNETQNIEVQNAKQNAETKVESANAQMKSETQNVKEVQADKPAVNNVRNIKPRPKIKPQQQEKAKQNTTDFFKLDEDFIPYANHFNENTILTKNLQLLQTIKINNFLNKELHHDVKHVTLREVIRNAIKNNIKSDNFAFWIHTVRRKADLQGILKSENQYSKFLNEKWNEQNHFESQFINELYVTIIIKGVEIKGKDVAIKYFTDEKLKTHFIQSEENKLIELTSAVDGMLQDLINYEPKRLGIVERDGVLYSENIEFFHKILNMQDVSAELDEADISSALSISKMSLSLNKLKLQNEFGENAISVLTLKHYLETKPQILDKILSLQFEFIIYQAFDFINISEVADKYENQYKMLRISKDFQMMKNLGFSDEEFGENNTESEKQMKYGENQIGIIVIGETDEKLEKETGQIVDVLAKTGFVVVRDDVMIEDTFFGSLPGNFFFLRRMQPIQTRKVAGFASIDNYPVGKIYKNFWGEALCLLKTKEGLPFFFNFHDDSGGGHTLFVGKSYDVQKNAIVNFLEMQSLKFNTRIINFDNDGNTKILNTFLEGTYKRLSEDKSLNTLNLNPFSLISGKLDAQSGDKIFENFLILLLRLQLEMKDTNLKYLKEKILPFALKNRSTFKTMKDLILAIKNEKVIKTFFAELTEDGTLFDIFNSEKNDILDSTSNFLSIDLGDIYQNAGSLQFFFEYFIEMLLLLTKDKKPTILKIDNFLELCYFCTFSSKKIAEILKEFKENNVVLLIVETYEFFIDREANAEDVNIMEHISTQIFSPAFVNYNTQEEVKSGYINSLSEFIKLTPYEKDVISSVSYDFNYFTLKHADKIIAIEFEPTFNDSIFYILTGREIPDEYLLGLKNAKTIEDKLKEIDAIVKQFVQ